MEQITLPEIGTFDAWRDAARRFLAEGRRPETLIWARGAPDTRDLFATAAEATATTGANVTRSFLSLATDVVWHRDPERFGRLYSLLWSVIKDGNSLTDRAEPELARLSAMAKEVRRDKHKMTAFVRFREIEMAGQRRRFVAWFEPSHFIAEPIAPFFARRFGDMDWTILTPDLTVTFETGALGFGPGGERPSLPEDSTEDLWRTYYRNIFNPARLKTKAMQAEMPKKYWKNLPEAQLIPGMIEEAEARVRAMAEKAPSIAPARARRIQEQMAERHDIEGDPPVPGSLDALASDMAGCRRCPLWKDATQVVPGEGPKTADLMFVGEQPGDREDLEGRPFVGPAGQLFDRALQAAGIDRSNSFVTNAVKHFKFTPRGKRRIHQNPNRGEIQHCRWWLDLERALVRPKLVVALGGTALESLTGDRRGILKRRGRIEVMEDGTPVFMTVHPSYILRVPSELRATEEKRFFEDLNAVRAHVDGMRAA